MISTERELHPLLKQISLWTAQVIISDHSNFLSWKGRTLEVVILKDAATLLDIALSQVQLLSAGLQPVLSLSSQQSLALIISLKAVLAFSQNGHIYI